MRKPKKDTSKMGKYDKNGSNNPNSVEKNGKLKDRSGDQYENIKNSNKKNGLRWTEEDKKKHSELMMGEKNWMRNKKHTEETKLKISQTKLSQYKNGEVKINQRCISNGEIEISKYLSEKGIKYEQQFTIPGYGFRYDFYLPSYNIILEYNGDYWHINPELFDESKVIDGKTANEIWKKDKIKKETAEINGYKFYTIWEKEFRPGYKNEYNLDILLNIINENENFVPGQ
jgi:G:T-mismatch repair DNA endonuclease (very short patch repair protein)